MARRSSTKATEPERPLELQVSRDEAKTRLQDRIEKGLEIKRIQINTQQALDEAEKNYDKWQIFNCELLRQLFTSDKLSKEYAWAGVNPVMAIGLGYGPSLGEKIANFYKRMDTKLHSLESIIERLELFPLGESMRAETIEAASINEGIARSRKVFVVHGHDEIAKTSLEVFLHENGLEPIVLHRQADEGMTIIEKFEKHSDVGYAFILLTPDEVAYLRADDSKPDEQRKKEFRARPNVIFEFGYFVGKLGRSRVCCLYTGDVTLPSDVHGMIYKRFNNSIEEVAYGILKDLKASGYTFS